jgi:hypothetical protein
LQTPHPHGRAGLGDAQPGITSPIIGPQLSLKDNLGAVDVTFSAEDYAQIDEVRCRNRPLCLLYRVMIDFKPPEYRQ